MAKKTEQTKSTKEAKQTKSMKKTETAKNTAADKSARGASKSIDTDKLVFGLDIGTRSIVATVKAIISMCWGRNRRNMRPVQCLTARSTI